MAVAFGGLVLRYGFKFISRFGIKAMAREGTEVLGQLSAKLTMSALKTRSCQRSYELQAKTASQLAEKRDCESACLESRNVT